MNNVRPHTLVTDDNLSVLRVGNSRADLICLDPPCNAQRACAVPIGSEAAGASFQDTWARDDVDMARADESQAKNHAWYAVIQAARRAHGQGRQPYLTLMRAAFWQ